MKSRIDTVSDRASQDYKSSLCHPTRTIVQLFCRSCISLFDAMFITLVQMLALVATVQGAVAKTRNAVDDLQNQAIAALKGVKTHGPQTCTLKNAAVRKDWASMSSKERKAYTTAVQCMLDSPSKSDPALVPGARNRYDDFVGQHINQTLTIHGTGNFLTWVSNLTSS